MTEGIQRYSGHALFQRDYGRWVNYGDHLAAVAAAREEERGKVASKLTEHLTMTEAYGRVWVSCKHGDSPTSMEVPRLCFECFKQAMEASARMAVEGEGGN